jgi:dipeptidyl aminopeptidase/acylaminoacyl peptidase
LQKKTPSSWQGCNVKTISAAVLAVIVASCVSTTPPARSPQPPAAEAPLLDRELFFGDAAISRPALSPDGRFITFVKAYRGIANLYVKTRAEPFDAARPLTAATRPIAGYMWSRDARYVLVQLDRGGDENFHVFAVDPAAAPEPATGVPPARDLTPGAAVRAELIDTPRSEPDTLIVGLNERDPQVSDVYRVSISSGQKTLLIKNTQNVAGWSTDRLGHVRVAERTTATGDHEVLRVDGDTLTSIYTCSAEETCEVATLDKQGTHVYLVTNHGAHDLTRLTLVDLVTGAEAFVEEDPEHQVDFGSLLVSGLSGEVLGTVYRGDRERVYPRDPVYAKDLATLRKALPSGDLAFLSRTSDEAVALVGNGSDVDLGAVYVYERATENIELLYRSRPELPSAHLAPMKPVHLTARDGVSLTAYLTVPLGTPAGEKRPAVVLVHGGPWIRDLWGYDGEAQFLANRGYLVLQPNFRGSSGFGKKFLNLGNGQWGTGTMQHDLTDAARWLVEQGLADSKRIAIMGGSYGGYATLAGLAFTPDVYAAGVDIVGPSNLMTLLSSIPPYWAPMRKMFSLRVGDLEADAERLTQQSPLFAAKNITAPLLVIQGANDPRVKRAEADQIVNAMASLSRPVEYVVAPDEGHGFHGRLNRLAMFVAIERFLGKHLGGRVQQDVSPESAERLAALQVDPASVKAPVRVDSLAAAVFDASRFTPAPRLRYRVAGDLQGQHLEGASTVTVAKTPNSGWTVSAVESLPQGETADTTTLALRTLLPTTRTIKQGPATVQLTYAGTSVSGNVDLGAQKVALRGSGDRMLVTNGLTLGLAVATLPLAEGYTVGLRSFDVASGQVQGLVLAVTGTDAVTVPAGRFETFRVDIAPEDSSSSTTLWVERSAGHRVVKFEQRLPQNQGVIASELLNDKAR